MPSFHPDLRSDMMDLITARADAGSGPAVVRIYDSTRPSPGGTAITTEVLLVECTCDDPFAPPTVAGTLSPTLPATATILADGDAGWYRVLDSDDNWVWDGDVGADMTITITSLVTGEPFDITSWSIVAGNE